MAFGAAYSYIASRRVESYDAEYVYNNTVSSILKSGILREIKYTDIPIVEKDTSLLDKNYDERSIGIILPPKHKNADIVGIGHNESLNIMLNDPTFELINTKSDQDLSTSFLLSPEFKDNFIANIEQIIQSDDFSIHNDSNEIQGHILEMYLEIHDLYTTDKQSAVELTNEYIRIIDSSEELNESEKLSIYSFLSVATYSTDFWCEKVL